MSSVRATVGLAVRGAVRRLRPLSEEECYLRCYGVDETTVGSSRLERAGRLRASG